MALGIGVVAAGTLWMMARHRETADRTTTVAVIEAVKPAPSVIVTPTVVASSTPEVSTGVTVVRPPGTGASQAQFIRVPQEMSVSLRPAPDPRLVEKTRFGPLPRRGVDGVRPAEAYARPVVIDSALRSDAPRIAIVVGGMGLNASLTSSAAEQFPPAVSFAFAPYGDDLDRQVQATRTAGHETLLQVPMEGFGDPASIAMSHLLMSGLDGRENLDRLHWHMGRFTGYVAVTNFLGGKFTAEASAFEPILRDVAGRGLFFFDDGSSQRSLAGLLAPDSGVSLVKADVMLDGSGEPAAVDAALAKLEARAKDRGVAVGFASGLPSAVNRIASFAQGLAGRNIALVPVSSLAPPAAHVVASP